MQWLRNEGDVLDVVAEEIAQSNELADLPKVVRWWHVTEELKFLATRLNAFRCQDKSQVGYLSVTEEALGQVDLELVFFEFRENLVEHL